MNVKYDLEFTINSWDEFSERIKVMSELPNGLGSHGLFLFRGQEKKDWNLSTSIQRKFREYNITSFDEAIEYEKNAEKYFLDKAKIYIPEMNKEVVYWDRLSRWEFMQHYGAGSRLLDWTRSPYIAMYFACFGTEKADGVIYRLSAAKFQNRQTVKHQKSMGSSSYFDYFIKELAKSLKGEPYERLIEIISDPFPTKRMVQQFSEFTITTCPLEPHDNLINESGNVLGLLNLRQAIIRYLIPESKKQEFLIKLEAMGIKEETVYPILDGTTVLSRNHKLMEKISYKPFKWQYLSQPNEFSIFPYIQALLVDISFFQTLVLSVHWQFLKLEISQQ